MTDEDRGILGFVVGLTFGTLLGAMSALLLAPQSGKKTRRQIRRTAEEWSETAGERLQAAGDKLHDAADDARRLADDAREIAGRSGERLAEKVEKGRKRLKV